MQLTKVWSHQSFHKLTAKDWLKLTNPLRNWRPKLATENCNRMNSKVAPSLYQILECLVCFLAEFAINHVISYFWIKINLFFPFQFACRRDTLLRRYQSTAIMYFGRWWNTTTNCARQRFRKRIQTKRLYFGNIELWSSYSRWCRWRTLVAMVPEILRKSTLDAFINATVNIQFLKKNVNKQNDYIRKWIITVFIFYLS